MGLFKLALQGDTCEKNHIDLLRIFGTAFMSDVEDKISGKSGTNQKPSVSNLLFTNKELEVIETELSKTLTPEKVQNAMKLLRAFQNESVEDKKAASVSKDESVQMLTLNCDQ